MMSQQNPLATVEQTALAAEITDEVRAQLPEEKARAEREMDATAREVLDGLAPSAFEGGGQPIGSIPRIVYFRWQQEYPGCWQDDQFKSEFLFDNPRCCIPGYKPRAKRLFFDMKNRNMKLNYTGGDIYVNKKAKVNELIRQDYEKLKAQRGIK